MNVRESDDIRPAFSLEKKGLPEHNTIITILSDQEYMQNMLNQLQFLKAMQKEEMAEKV